MRLIPLLLLTVAGLVWATPAEAAGKVGVINLVQAVQDHPRTKVVEENLRKARTQAQEDQKRDNERLEALKVEFGQTQEGEPRRETLEKQILLQQNNMKFNAEWAALQATRAYVRALEDIYRAVTAMVGHVARDKGLELVLLQTEPNQALNASDPQDFALKTRLRVVVFAEKSTDITKDVIARLNPEKK